jgi:mannose-6-phosphate isomerase-like protein (cupin superfamily)
MTVYHLHGDDTGETHLTPIELTLIDAGESGEGSANRVRVMPRFPAYDLGLAEIVDPLQDTGIHEAPRRQFLAILRGEYEIITTSGEQVRLQPGDCLFTDDVGTSGHWSKEVGDEPLTMVSVGVPDDWAFPG